MIIPKIYPVACHTRNIGIGSTFVAIDGFKARGVDFIQDAILRGATKIVLHKKFYKKFKLQNNKEIKFFFVSDPRIALAELSSKALSNPAKKLKIIGITGTKGKTTTAFLVEHFLSCAGYKTAMLGSIKNKILGSEIKSDLTTPESDYLHMFFDQCVKKRVEYVVMEVSSHSIKLNRIYDVLFDIVGFTNLGPEHLDFHKTVDNYFETKFKLFSQVKKTGSIVINTDDKWGQKAFKKFKEENKNFKNIYKIEGRFASFNAYNISMASLICKQLGLSEREIEKAIKSFGGIPGRMQKHRLKNGAISFVDFAHEPLSFEAVLKTLRPLTKNLIILFGCGGERDKTKRPVMGKLASQYGDKIILTDDNPRDENKNLIIKDICKGICKTKKRSTFCINDRREAIKKAVEISDKNTIIAILGKGHESYYLYKGRKYKFDDFKEISFY